MELAGASGFPTKRIKRPTVHNGNAFGLAQNYPNWKSFCVTLTRESLFIYGNKSALEIFHFPLCASSTWSFCCLKHIYINSWGESERRARVKDAERESAQNKFLYIQPLRTPAGMRFCSEARIVRPHCAYYLISSCCSFATQA